MRLKCLLLLGALLLTGCSSNISSVTSQEKPAEQETSLDNILQENSSEENTTYYTYDKIHDFLGVWESEDNIKLDFHTLTEYNEIIFDIIFPDCSYVNCNSYVDYVEYGSISSVKNASYFAKFEYEDKYVKNYSHYTSVEYQTRYICCDELAFNLYDGLILWTRHAEKGVIFNKQIERKESKDFSYNSYLNNFGRMDDNKITGEFIPEETRINDAKMIVDYLNKINDTSIYLDYLKDDLEFMYDYKYGNIIYSVFNYHGYYFYLDVESNSVILEEKTYLPDKTSLYTKKLIYDNSSPVNYLDNMSGSYKCDNIELSLKNISSNKQDVIMMFDDCIFDNLSLNGMTVFQYSWSKMMGRPLTYIDFYSGDKFFSGYILYDEISWSLTLHITRSNVKNINIGIYPLQKI